MKYLSPDLKLELDLGKIGNIAEVEINEKKGTNELTVNITNTKINRVSAFKEIVPQDLMKKC